MMSLLLHPDIRPMLVIVRYVTCIGILKVLSICGLTPHNIVTKYTFDSFQNIKL
jgi:hypothetical protein